MKVTAVCYCTGVRDLFNICLVCSVSSTWKEELNLRVEGMWCVMCDVCVVVSLLILYGHVAQVIHSFLLLASDFSFHLHTPAQSVFVDQCQTFVPDQTLWLIPNSLNFLIKNILWLAFVQIRINILGKSQSIINKSSWIFKTADSFYRLIIEVEGWDKFCVIQYNII